VFAKKMGTAFDLMKYGEQKWEGGGSCPCKGGAEIGPGSPWGREFAKGLCGARKPNKRISSLLRSRSRKKRTEEGEKI